jgi:hypothetical protein
LTRTWQKFSLGSREVSTANSSQREAFRDKQAPRGAKSQGLWLRDAAEKGPKGLEKAVIESKIIIVPRERAERDNQLREEFLENKSQSLLHTISTETITLEEQTGQKETDSKDQKIYEQRWSSFLQSSKP